MMSRLWSGEEAQRKAFAAERVRDEGVLRDAEARHLTQQPPTPPPPPGAAAAATAAQAAKLQAEAEPPTRLPTMLQGCRRCCSEGPGRW